MTSLADVWSNYNESHGLHRVLEDAKYYERHLPPRSGTSQLRLLEIGIQYVIEIDAHAVLEHRVSN